MTTWILIAVFILFPTLVHAAVNTDLQLGEGRVLASQGGRYVFGALNAFPQNAFMLDTKTGKLWQLTTIQGSAQMGLMPALFLLPGGKCAYSPDATEGMDCLPSNVTQPPH